MSLGITKQQTKMVAVLLCGSLLTVLNLTVLSPALPIIMSEMNVDATTIQWLSSGYGLVEAIVIPLSAWLLGRFRTRQLFICGELLFAVGSIVAACAPIFPVLLMGRLIQAVSTGIIMTMAMTLNVLIFPREKRGTAMGIIGLIIGFAPAIGPTLGGLAADSIGWRALFVLVTILTVLIIAFAYRVLTDFEGFERSRFDVPSVILSSLGLLCFLYGVSTFTSSPALYVPVICIVVGIVFLAAFVRRQNKLETPFLRINILKTRQYRVAVITVICLQAALIGLNVVFPLFIQQVLGFSATTSGLIMLPGALLGAFFGFFCGRMFDRVGIRPLALVASVLLLAAALLLGSLTQTSSIINVILASVVLGIGIQSLQTPINTWGLNSLSNDVVQHANAVSNTVNQVAGSFGTALIVSLSALSAATIPDASALEQTATGYHYSFLSAGVLLVIAGIIVVCFARNKKSDKPTATQSPNISPVVEQQFSLDSVMNRQSISLSVDATVKEAILIFSKANTSGAPIVDNDNRVIGFLSTGDIIKHLGDIESSLSTISTSVNVYHIFDDMSFKDRVADLLDLSVMDIATKKVIGITPDTSLEKACTILAQNKIKKLPIMDESGLVGVISRKNVMNAIAQTLE